MGKYTYILLLLFSIAYPLAQSFEWRLSLWKQWRFMFPAFLLTAALFIGWDIYFAYADIWGFNPDFVLGIWLFKLPLEEWLFFIVVPYACYFIFAVINYYFPRVYRHKLVLPLHWLLVLSLLLVGIVSFERTYTAVAFLLAALVLAIIGVKNSLSVHLPRYYTIYFVSLIPFLIINGVLTALPVVYYNNHENLGMRLLTIPVEDTIYLLSLLFINFALIDTLKARWKND